MAESVRSRVAVYLVVLAIVASLLAIWQRQASTSHSVEFFFSSPLKIAAALWDGLVTGVSVSDLWASGVATIGGLAIGIACGSAIGSAAVALPAIRGPIKGSIAMLAALPILAIAPMFLIWFGTGLALKVVLGAILSALVIAARTMNSDQAVSVRVHEFLEANGIPTKVRLRKVTLPASLEWTLVAVPAAANASFLGVFIGEFVAADRGIGYRILRAGALYQVDVVLAQTLLALGMLLVIQLAAWLFRDRVAAIARYASLDPLYR